MALVTVGSSRVRSMEMHRPSSGQWSATVELDADEPPTGPVTVTIGEDGYTIVGRVDRSGVFVGSVTCRLLGGLGDLSTQLPPRYYLRAPARTVVTDLLSACGSRLSSTSDALDVRLPSWARVAGTGREALSALTGHLGLVWRVLDDGTVFVGQPTWTPVEADYVVVDRNDADRRLTLASDDPRISGGISLDGLQLVNVVSTWGSTVRHDVWLSP